jgi:hypothetical protein
MVVGDDVGGGDDDEALEIPLCFAKRFVLLEG